MMPVLDARSRDNFLEELCGLAVDYVPEWQFDPELDEFGSVLLALFAELMEMTVLYRNKLPEIGEQLFMDRVSGEQKQPGYAGGMVTFGLTKPDLPDALVEAGAVVLMKGKEGQIPYVTLEETLVTGACPGQCPVKALQPGEAGNLPAGCKGRLERSVGFVSKIENQEAFTGGAETAEQISPQTLAMPTWKDSVKQMRRRLVELNADWTSHNLQEPGMTLLELMVWMQQMQMYQTVQVTDAWRGKCLKLMGGSPKPRTPGRGWVHVDTREQQYLPEGTRFYAEKTCFESVRGQMVSGRNFARLAVYSAGKGKAGPAEQEICLEGEWMENGKNICVFPFGQKPGAGAVFELLLKQSLETGRLYRLYVDVPKGNAGRVDEGAFDGHGFYPLAETAMEYQTAEGWRQAVMKDDSSYGLIQEGSVNFVLPQSMDEGNPCLRFVLKRSEYLTPPCITRISLAMAEVRQMQHVQDQLEFMGTGLPWQRFFLERGNLCLEFLVVETEEKPSRRRRWQQVTDFQASGPEDYHYRMEQDQLVFGDGFCGRMPEGRIRVTGLVESMGKRGNVRAGAINSMADRPEQPVVNEKAVGGGMDPETLEDALNRCAGELRATGPARTPEDYERLVMSIPGIAVLACRAWYEPDSAVMNVAVRPEIQGERGMLNDACRRNLYRFLEEKREAGTRIRLLSPAYCTVSITCRCLLETASHQAEERTEEWLRRWVAARGFGEGIEYGRLTAMLEELPFLSRVEELWIDHGRNGRRSRDGDVMLPGNGILLAGTMRCIRVAAQEMECTVDEKVLPLE